MKQNKYRCLISSTLGKRGKVILMDEQAALPYLAKGLIVLAEETVSVQPEEVKEVKPLTQIRRGRPRKK
jgi:hypothetical protein